MNGRRNYKSVCAVVITALVCFWTICSMAQPYEPFNYPVGTSLVLVTNATGNWWTAAGPAGTPASVVAGNLYVSGLAVGTTNCMQFGAVTGPSARFNLISNTTSGTLYFSLALKVTDLGALSTNNGYIGGFNNSRGTQANIPAVIGTRIMMRATSSSRVAYNFGVAKNSTNETDFVWSPAAFTTNDTVFLVGSYQFNSANSTDDICSLWINPGADTFSAAEPPSPSLIATSGADMTSSQIASFVLLQRGASNTNQPANIIADELRIGPTWASVTPTGPIAPTILTQPRSQSANAGSNVTFSVYAGGTPPFSYQWRFNGSAISGATEAIYARSNLALADSGSYSVVVTNINGSITSSNAVLSIIFPISKGHRLLMQHGLQVQAMAVDNYGTNLVDFNVFDNAGFNAIDWQFNPYGVNYMTSTNRPWSGVTLDYSHTNLTIEAPYASSCVSYQIDDEQNLNDVTVRSNTAAWFAAARPNFPNTILRCNQIPFLASDANYRDFLQTSKPDMIMMDSYRWTTNGDTSWNLYSDMERYRLFGLSGYDGTYTQPIPYALYPQGVLYGRYPSESENRASHFVAWTMGYTYSQVFTYNTTAPSPVSILFSGGCMQTNPTPAYYQFKEINRQSKNLGPALVRLLNTDLRFIGGQKLVNGSPVTNPNPIAIPSWTAGAGGDGYLHHFTITNIGTKNDVLSGDVMLSWFKVLHPSLEAGYSGEKYFMVCNAFTDTNGSAADCRQRIQMNFDFGQTGIDTLQRLSRDTGQVEEIALPLVNGYRQFTLDIDGGTADLFKYKTGAPFIGIETTAPPLQNQAMLANTDGTISMTWSAQLGNSYTLQYKNALTDAQWITLTNAIVGSNPFTITDNPGTNMQRFYRLLSPTDASATVGFLKLGLLGNSDTFVSLAFTRTPAITATVASVLNNSITVSDATNWTPNQFVYSAGTQSNTYCVRFTSGASEGRIYTITGNTTNTLTIGTNTVAANTGDALVIEPYWTLATVFPNGAGVNVSPTPGNRNTEVLLPDFTNPGINLSAAKIYYFNSGYWKQVGDGSVNHNDDPLLPNTHFAVRHNVSTNTTLALFGNVATSKLNIALRAVANNQQDNMLGLLRPPPVSLNDSGLITSGAFSASPLPGNRTDELLTFDNTATNRNKSASSVFYYWNGAWRLVGAGTIDVGTNQPLGGGTGFIIRKGTNVGPVQIWTNSPNY